MFTTPLRSENIPPIAPNESGVAKPEHLGDQRRVEDGVQVPGARAGRQDAEPEADHARRDRALAEPGAAAGRRPDPEHRRDDADGDRPGDRASLDRRNGQERREDAEQDAGDSRSPPDPRRRALSGFRAAAPTRSCRPPPPFRLPLELPARVPDVQDQHVGPDEEHDQALDDEREIAGQLGLDHVRAEAVRRAVEQPAEEQRAEPDAGRVLRPSSATAMPRKPTLLIGMSVCP